MYRGKPGEAALDDSLCDSLITRGQRFAVYPPKATIASQLAKLCGWDAPAKLEIENGVMPNTPVSPGRQFSHDGRLLKATTLPGMESLISCASGNGIPRKRIHCFNKIGTDLYLKSLPAWREEAKSGDEEVKYGHRTRT
jgi:hypothetical protein